MSEQRKAGTMRKLEHVNRFFDQPKSLDDSGHWARDDYRTTPLEALSNNGGDCKDFTIDAYFTLKQLALPERQMRLISFKSGTFKQPPWCRATMPTHMQAAASGR